MATVTDPELEQRLERLRARAAAPPARTWRYEDEPELAGFYVERGPRELPDGQRADVVILADARTGEERAVWLWHTILRSRFDELLPEPGQLVLIQYLGREQSKAADRSSYHNYAVVVERGAAGGAPAPAGPAPAAGPPRVADAYPDPAYEEPPWPLDEPGFGPSPGDEDPGIGFGP